jgi:GT2 family glycosyltransferase
MPSTLPLSIAIPTYRRESVLVDTLEALSALDARAAEILVLDQTELHHPATIARLQQMAEAGQIRWLRLPKPAITAAMNEALRQASQEIVLFLDDDIRPEPGLVAAHAEAHRINDGLLVAGKVLQPWDEGRDYSDDAHFHFACDKRQWTREFMGGNFSVDRARAASLGGFDENFVRVAYRFEAEFAFRWLASGGRILFEPSACLHHLKEGAGGTRTYGNYLTTWRPDHAVGAYYYSLRCRKFGEFVVRPCRAVATRYHLRHPWRIPATIVAELGGMLWALALYVRGPRRLGATSQKGVV